MNDYPIIHFEVTGRIEFLGEGIAIGDSKLEDREMAGIMGSEFADDIIDVVHTVEVVQAVPQQLAGAMDEIQVGGRPDVIVRKESAKQAQKSNEWRSVREHWIVLSLSPGARLSGMGEDSGENARKIENITKHVRNQTGFVGAYQRIKSRNHRICVSHLTQIVGDEHSQSRRSEG
ncbi:MAG: hypothetical protein IPK19_07710 [Chloroflexi bacterium]|nr:hypothetical protein [Chloroflexota bacterium]